MWQPFTLLQVQCQTSLVSRYGKYGGKNENTIDQVMPDWLFSRRRIVQSGEFYSATTGPFSGPAYGCLSGAELGGAMLEADGSTGRLTGNACAAARDDSGGCPIAQ